MHCKRIRKAWWLNLTLAAILAGTGCLPTAAQTSTADAIEALKTQIDQLRAAMSSLQGELAAARRETELLRRDVRSAREQLAAPNQGAPEPATARRIDEKIGAVEEEQQLLGAKLADHDQSKVESGSKYRVRLSGMALLNLFSNQGAVDNIDVPGFAQARPLGDSGGSFGMTARQSLLRVEVFGPRAGGASTRGEASFDFFGGFPATGEGVTSGLARLRTASVSLDWKHTSVTAGQDAPFFSPLSPSSLASMAYPALSYAGNMWTWTPQVRVEQRFDLSDRSKISLQAGILDSLTGAVPESEYARTATAGERSRAPAYATRIGWSHSEEDGVLAFGGGGYYSRQDWLFGRTVNAWAAAADWEVPIGPRFSLSGELYRGRAIGGLGAGVTGSVLFDGSPFSQRSRVAGIESAGGWAQLKFKLSPKLEFNSAFGGDYPIRLNLKGAVIDELVNGSGSSRNRAGFVNAIYQVRSNLLFSVEYRRLWTARFAGPTETAGHINIGGGITF